MRYVDFPPSYVSPMHRTTSIDYGIVVFGSFIVCRIMNQSTSAMTDLRMVAITAHFARRKQDSD